MSPVFIFNKMTVISGIRSKAFWLILFITVLLFSAAFLSGSFSSRQPLVVSLDVGYTAARIGLLFLALVWTQELLQKDLDKKTVHWAVAYPCSRASYLLGKLLGISALLLMSTIIFSLPLWWIANYASWGYEASSLPYIGLSYPISMFGLWLESMIILAFTACMITISTTPFLAIAIGLLFSLAGRGLGAVLDFLLFSPYADASFKAKFLPIANTLRWFLPDLSALDWRQATLYGHWQGLYPGAAICMALGYILIFTALSMIIFNKRALN
ncbi:ABC transporter permease [Deefgea tanakiae]|uniref:ABC transporter permease n=1 Tax=Deefgea tanakiae TaxID=2865840 RepID=A0ABX8Z2M2_9NEIS|nr:ABC transporter permease subunit [Deefgea tanakiae]QZA76836.1 ABC transporter permease [Deefgea tanakiae]